MWVDHELETALGKEQKLHKERGKKVRALVPLNLDGYLFEGDWKSGMRRQVQRRLAEHAPWKFEHHLGHGVGLAGHEGPRLNPHWDDTFEEGNFFTVEPGLYHDDLRQGIRLEQNYLVTSDGVKLLTDWPLEL